MDPADLRVVAHRLRVDRWAAEAVRTLGDAGVRCVLLKGPSIARWLYPGEPAARDYSDVDLLVAPADRARAAGVLVALGYRRDGDPLLAADEPHARAYRRPSDHAVVDLHTGFHGLRRADPDAVWRVASTGTEPLEVGGAAVEVPPVHVRAMLLALHVSPKNETGSRAWQDLLDGIDRLDEETWRRAAAAARELGVEDELGHRLSRPASGHALAVRLGLPTAETATYAEDRLAQTGASPPGVGSLLRLRELDGRRARARYVRDKLLPPPAVLRDRLPRTTRLLGPRVARVLWPVVCAGRLPRALAVTARLRRS